MSNVFSKPPSDKPPSGRSDRGVGLRNYLVHSSHIGAAALVEFLLLATLSLEMPHLPGRLAVRLASAAAIIIGLSFVVHCVVMLRRRVWDPWFSLLAVLLVYFLAQAIAGALVYIYPLAQGWSESRATFWLNNSVIAQFAYFLLATGLSLGAIYGYLRWFRIKLSAIGLRRPRGSDLLYGLAAVPFYFILYLVSVGIISHFVPGLDVNQKQQLGFDNVHGLTQLALTFASLVILPPLMEEIMIRGLLYSSLKKAMPTTAAVLVTSLIFATAHLPEGGATGPLYIAALDTFVLSLVLIYLREKTGGLWSSMTLHAIKNLVAFTALFIFHAG